MSNKVRDFEAEVYDKSLDEFPTYEDYLDKFITEEDLEYLEKRELARDLIELGLHAKIETLKRDEFYEKKAAAEEFFRNRDKESTTELYYKSVPADKYNKDPFLLYLANHEASVRNGRRLIIIFLRYIGKHEISGYIDLADRLKNENFKPYFEGKKLLLPKPTDLSFFNW